MRKLMIAAAMAVVTLSTGAGAQLPVGAKAPQFTTMGALAGKPYAFDLAKALKKGPVVLYFYPKAFTKGCTLEAHAFAEASPDFAKLGAQVIGMSADDLPTLEKFSTEECRDKFAVAVATPAIIKAYDVPLKLVGMPSGLTDRTSYVIAQNGKITLVHSDLDFKDHVKLTMDAVRALKTHS
jgi:peroxiredoxin Q/BCP